MSVIIYGMGNMGRGAVSLLIRKKINISCFFDKGVKESRSINICGREIPVYHPEDTRNADKNADILIAMAAAPLCEVQDYLNGLGFKNVVSVGDYITKTFPSIRIVNVWSLSKSQYERIYDFYWDDKESANQWKIACEWFFARSEKTVKEICFRPDREKYLTSFVIDSLSDNAVMIDSALLDGEYSRKFIDITGGRSYAFKLHPETLCGDIPDSITVDDRELFSCVCNVMRRRMGYMEPFDKDVEQIVRTVSIDEFVEKKDIKPDILRVYSMSEACDILNGAVNTIKRCRPIIAVNIGHFLTDFIIVPFFLRTYCDDYRFIFRVHSFQGNDCIMYAIPL